MKTACLLAFSWTAVVQTSPAEVAAPTPRQKALEALEAALDDHPEISENFADPSVGYLYGHQLLRKAEKAADRKSAALNRQSALKFFQQVKDRFPEWKPEMVNARIEVTLAAIAAADAERSAK